MLARLASVLFFVWTVVGQQTGNHPDWPRWCGKVYESGYPAFNPGGQTVEPPRNPSGPRLYVQIAPRYSLYLDSEAKGEFIVRTTLSPYFGNDVPAALGQSSYDVGDRELHFVITLDGANSSDNVLVSGTSRFNFKGRTTQETLVPFNLTSALKASFSPQNVTLTGWVASPDGSSNSTHTAKSSDFVYLPDKPTGSVTRLDNAYGGFMHRGGRTGSSKNLDYLGFRPYFPYGYYSSFDGFLAGVTDNVTASAIIGRYAGFGLNAMTPLSQYPQSAIAFDYMASQTNIGIQFDLREGYTNLTWVSEQVTAARDSAALFSYWSADEPDGHQDPFGAPVLARDTIRRIDPYHPVAVVLNCQNYYFAEYTAGADVIMEDVYPIGINTTGITKWGTECNSTLGDCGCDNCQGGNYSIRDVADRLDNLALYETWTDNLWPKTKIHNPQSFHGEGYWGRDPTDNESWAMSLVAVNHGAQGLISWVYPVAGSFNGTNNDTLPSAHGWLAQVLTQSPIVDFLVGNARPTPLPVPSLPNLDVACWRRDKQLLVSIVNSGYEDYILHNTSIYAPQYSIPIPQNVWLAADQPYSHISAVVWSPNKLIWTYASNNLSTRNIPALSTGLVILSV
ncbi:hypothetical protein SBRCBS47491_005635 [Sporothrix bragantina]|uniref:Glycoside hydrolase subgroup catalytic core n=1 Tax=Sporothrix bragantina TaxID=671064 RepID=A0ABP0BYD9_9PEZI